MGRSPNSCCSKDDNDVLNCGAWTASEDKILSDYINTNGVGGWRSLPKKAGLKRGGKSCRLRWLNYLRPDIKRGNISSEEEELLIRLHRLLGNRWSLIAGRLPGRTDNELKNYWNTHLSKRIQMGEYQPKIKKPCKRRDMPSCSDEVVQTDKDICQNPEANGLKVADDHAVEIDTSKSWGQLLLEDCMGDYDLVEQAFPHSVQFNSTYLESLMEL